MIVEQVTVESLLGGCLLKTLLALGMQKMRFEDVPGFISVWFGIPVLAVVKVLSGAVDEVISVV